MTEQTNETIPLKNNFLDEIETQLLEINKNLKEYAKTLEFVELCEFTIENCEETIPWEAIDCSGLYLIEIKNNTKHNTFKEWITDFQILWEDRNYKYKFVPNIKKMRIRTHSELTDYIPMYIGKSKRIKGRVYEHIFKDINKTTFALKLKARENIKNETFRLSFLRVDTNNYDWIVPVIERTLRNKINPIIGKQ